MSDEVAATPTGTESLTNSTIRSRMDEARITQTALAEALGISQPQVSARLTGSVGWRLAELVTVSRVLGVRLTDLVQDAA